MPIMGRSFVRMSSTIARQGKRGRQDRGRRVRVDSVLTGTKEEGISRDTQVNMIDDGSVGNNDHE